MKWKYALLSATALLTLGRCICAPEPAPGLEGDACDDAAPCAEGLSCIDGTCVGSSADAGRSDAGVGDVVGADTATTDTAGPDTTGTDLGAPDTAQPDTSAPDAGTADTAAPDTALPVDAALPDTGTVIPDGGVTPDAIGWDLAWLSDASIFNDGGLAIDVRAFDTGVARYSGDEEDGVVCGSPPNSCDLNDYCCIYGGLPPTLVCDDSQPYCEGAFRNLECDGPEDCAGGEECCATATWDTYCTAANACYSDNASNALICVDDTDCRGGFVCCATTIFASLGVDIGWCQSWCNP